MTTSANLRVSACPRIAVVNHSTLLSDVAVKTMVPAIQHQVSIDFAPIWGMDAIIESWTLRPIPFMWVAGIFDDADQAGALGYHDLTAGGKPLIKVFVHDSESAGVPISSVLSHEVLETLADAFIESTALLDNGDGTGTLYAMEVCDPVENDVYSIYGVPVSNFITPYWFGDTLPSGGRFDYMKKLTAPFSMTSGGYFSSRPISKTGLGDWQESYADAEGKRLSALFRRKK